MNKFEYYTFVKGLQGLPRYKKDLILAELKRRVEILE